MGKITLSIVKWHPLVLIVAYVSLIADYRHYLDGRLNYIKPQIPGAPEDILGFGFWVTWLIVAVWFAIACILSYWVGSQRKIAYWLPLLFAFSIVTVMDFYLYGVLERQVLAG